MQRINANVRLIMFGTITIVPTAFVRVEEFLILGLVRANAPLDLIGVEFNVSLAMIPVYGCLIRLLVYVLLAATKFIIHQLINVPVNRDTN